MALLNIQTIDPNGVVSHELFTHFRLETNLINIIGRFLKIKHREVRSEDDLVLAVTVDVMSETLGPVFWSMGIAPNVNVFMFPSH